MRSRPANPVSRATMSIGWRPCSIISLAASTRRFSTTSAVTCWTDKADGWHVVTTVDTVTGQGGDAEKHAVVRFSSLLLPGPSQLISVPFAIGEQQQVLRIRRRGDQVEIALVPSPSS